MAKKYKSKKLKKAQQGDTSPMKFADTQAVDPDSMSEMIDEISISKLPKIPLNPRVKKVSNDLRPQGMLKPIDLNSKIAAIGEGRDLSHPTALATPKNKKPLNWSNIATTTLAAVDMLIPEERPEWPVVQPTNSYNQYQYGTGSQAIAKHGVTISKTGYSKNSKDKNKSKLRIPSNNITMEDVEFPILGKGSDGTTVVMQPGENYIFPNAEYVDETPVMQQGGNVKKPQTKIVYTDSKFVKLTPPKKKQQEPLKKEPIIVNDKNDPRLKAYNDSLNLYKAYQMQDKLMGTGKGTPQTFDKKYSWTTKELRDRRTPKKVNGLDLPVSVDFLNEQEQFSEGFNSLWARKEDKKLLNYYKSLGFKPSQIMYHSSPDVVSDNIRPIGNYFDGTATSPVYKKPVQPVIYQEEKKLKKPIPVYSKKSLLNFDTNGRPTPDAPPEFQIAQFDNTKPTKYSFSYPTGKYNEQKTVYFPDAGSWKQFIGNQKLINSDEGKDYGTATGYMQKGGKMTANKGLSIEDNKFTPISDKTLMINGNSHDDGGTFVQYGDKVVEAEKGEPLSINMKGEAVIFGNMKNPITGNKFKKDAEMIAKKEKKVGKLMDYSTSIVNNVDPFDKWGSLKFNAAKMMMMGAKKKEKELMVAKEHLGDVQDALLSIKEEESIARNGKIVKAQDGWSTLEARRHRAKSKQKPIFDFYTTDAKKLDPDKFLSAIYSNEGGETGVNPPIKGNASGKYALMPATQQDMYNKYYKSKMSWDAFKKSYDTDATFEYEVAKALATEKINQYKTAAEAIGSWYNPKSVKDKKWDEVPFPEYGNKISIRQYVDKAANNYFSGKNSASPTSIYKSEPAKVSKSEIIPTDLQDVQFSKFQQSPIKSENNRQVGDYQYNWNLETPKDIPVESDAKGLDFQQVMGEVYAGATNREEPVWLQQYNPELFQDYEMSLQDRRNRVTSQGRASRQYLSDNAGAQAVLAAEEHNAIGGIDAEEFRINQHISSDIVNKNKLLLNEAQGKNLQLADQQYVRQSTARSKTKATNQAILNSISSKILQNKLENSTLQVYENLYPHFRYNDQYQLKKEGNPGQDYLNTAGLQPLSTNTNTAVKTKRDASGTVVSTEENNPGWLKTQKDMEELTRYKNRSISQILNSKKANLWEK